MKKWGKTLRALLATAVAALVAGGALPAGATDMAELTARAQEAADQVSELERRLAGLDLENERLTLGVETTSREIGALEHQMRATTEALEAAEARYVERAVELYKSSGTADIEILLTATDLTEVLTLARAASATNDAAVQTLRELQAANERTQSLQDAVDDRKARLVVAQARAEELVDEVAAALKERKRVLDDLTARINELEERARAAAAQSADPSSAFMGLFGPSGPSAGIPEGFVGTGVTFEGIASWYGPGFEGNTTANGDIFDPDLFTVASKTLPFGTWLYVEYEGRGVVVLVNDRGPYVGDRILDLSQAAAEAIGISGLGWVRAEILLKA